MKLKEYIKLVTHQINEAAQPYCDTSFPIKIHFDIYIDPLGEEIMVTDNPNSSKISFEIMVYLK